MGGWRFSDVVVRAKVGFATFRSETWARAERYHEAQNLPGRFFLTSSGLSLLAMCFPSQNASSEPTAKNYNLRVELAQHHGILRWLCGRFEQSDTGESCGVALAEGEQLGSNLLHESPRGSENPGRSACKAG